MLKGEIIHVFIRVSFKHYHDIYQLCIIKQIIAIIFHHSKINIYLKLYLNFFQHIIEVY